jgi:MFS family permease
MRRPLALRTFEWLFPRRFYGNVVLVGCASTFLAAIPGQSFFLGLFTERFIDDFGLSRTFMSTIFASAFISSAFAVQVMGRVIDLFGPKRIIICSILPYFVGIMLISTATGPAQIVGGFVLTRVLGPDGINFAGKVIINRWFEKRRGRAMAVASITEAIKIMLSGAFSVLSDSIGWRGATALAAGIAVLLITFGLLLIFDSPELLMLLPDGDAPREEERTTEVRSAPEHCQNVENQTERDSDDRDGAGTPTVEAIMSEPPRHFTRREVLRTRAGSVLLALTFVVNVGWGGINAHLRSVCAEQGALDNTTVPVIYTAIGACTPLGSLTMGWALDRSAGQEGKLRACMAVPALSLVSLALSSTLGVAPPPWPALAFGIASGLFLGAFTVYLGAAFACLFGRGPHLGSIQALLVGASALGIAAGPVLLALGRNAVGGYRPIIAGVAAAVASCAIALVRTQAPGPPSGSTVVVGSAFPGRRAGGVGEEHELGLRQNDSLR